MQLAIGTPHVTLSGTFLGTLPHEPPLLPFMQLLLISLLTLEPDDTLGVLDTVAADADVEDLDAVDELDDCPPAAAAQPDLPCVDSR